MLSESRFRLPGAVASFTRWSKSRLPTSPVPWLRKFSNARNQLMFSVGLNIELSRYELMSTVP